MMKIGVSLPPKMLTETIKESVFVDMLKKHGGIDKILEQLKAVGVTHIELRTVLPDTDPQLVADAVDRVHKAGLSFTVHGEIHSEKTAVADVFEPLSALLASEVEHFPITIHPLDSGEGMTPYDTAASNARVMTALLETIEPGGYPVTIALEYKRFKTAIEPGHSVKGLLDIMRQVPADPRMGLCFDFGHYYDNIRRQYQHCETIVPNEEFLRLTRHTHIHGFDGNTHFPLTLADTFLPYYMKAMAAVEYDGVYNLELSPKKYADRTDPMEAFLSSIEILKKSI